MRSSGSVAGFLLAWLLVLGLSVGAAYLSMEHRREVLLQAMTERAQRCAIAFATDDTAMLTGTRADLYSPAYRTVKERLRRLAAVSKSVRFVYLFRSTDQLGRVVFLADSEPPESKDISLPGDDYDNALGSPGLQEILRGSAPTTEGPLRDEWGEWITAYALVGDQPLPGAPRIILGIDVDSAEWRAELRNSGLAALAIALVCLGLPVGLFQTIRHERSLSREVRRLSVAVQQSRSAVVILAADRTIEYANQGCLNATGYKLDELIGQPVDLLLPKEFPAEERAEAFGLARRTGWQGELRVRRRNAETYAARASLSPVRDSMGKVVSLIAVVDDISDFKRAENELRVARDQAQAADRAKGEFLAVMSHELRTPLNGIIGFATLLQETPLSAEQADYATTIRRSGEALLTLTNDLLDYSRIDAGRMQLDLQTCSPRVVVEEAVELLATRAADKQLELLVSIGPEVPTHVLADPGRLRQVLVNLIGNAIKFTPAGEVEVELIATPLKGPDSARIQLEFIVRDSGVGIPANLQDRLFKPFSQVDGSSKRRHGGAGLGLAISRSLVHLMQGEIDVNSSEGAGSVFRFTVPVRVIENAVLLSTLPARRVAIVSSNTRARRHYTKLLERWGLQVRAHENVTKLPVPRDYDVVLVDVQAQNAAIWPEILRGHAGLSEVPVVGLVSVSVPGAQRDELRAHFRSLLKKPLRDTLCHAVLQSLLKG